MGVSTIDGERLAERVRPGGRIDRIGVRTPAACVLGAMGGTSS